MQLMAHRGGAGLRVENTLAAFACAIDLNACGAELDVHLSRDGGVVVHHNTRLNPGYCRHVGGDWLLPPDAPKLNELTVAELQRYDIGTPRPGSEYARGHERIRPVSNQRIPLLRDVIRLVKEQSPDFVLAIEIKTPLTAAAQRPWVSLVDKTLAIVDAENFLARTVLCSFDWGALRYAKERAPSLVTWFTACPFSWFGTGQPPAADIPKPADELRVLRDYVASGSAPWFAGFDPGRFGGSYPKAVAAAGGDGWFPFHRDVTNRAVVESRTTGLLTAAWSSNLRDDAELRRLADAGVDCCVIDYPDMAVPAGVRAG